MPTFLRPGAYINEVLTSSAATPGAVTATAVAAFTGASNRGPTVPTLVFSWADYQSKFGDFTNSAYLAYAVYMFFHNGGAQCWVTRVAQAGQVLATRTLNDTAGSPLPTLKVNAFSPGAWGNQVFVDVTAGSTGRFNLVIYSGGTTINNVVENWTDLSMVATDARYAPSVVNGNSTYIALVDLFSATAFPNNAPAVQAGTALATGADGAAVSASDYNTSLAQLGKVPQPIVLNLPGVNDATTLANAVTLATTNGWFVVADPPATQTPAQVITWAGTLTASSYVAAYYPWIVVNDPAKFTPGATITIPPGGAVVGQFLSTDASIGPFKTPAGVANAVAGAVDLESQLTTTDYDTLNSGTPPVNAIKALPGYGICIFGGRTLKAGYSDKYIAIRRSLIYLEKLLKDATAYAIFEPNDGRLWQAISSKVNALLNIYYAAGGLSGATAANAFYVVCDATNNTPLSVSNGVVNLEVGVALQYPAEFVVIKVAQFDGGTTVTNSIAQ